MRSRCYWCVDLRRVGAGDEADWCGHSWRGQCVAGGEWEGRRIQVFGQIPAENSIDCRYIVSVSRRAVESAVIVVHIALAAAQDVRHSVVIGTVPAVVVSGVKEDVGSRVKGSHGSSKDENDAGESEWEGVGCAATILMSPSPSYSRGGQ